MDQDERAAIVASLRRYNEMRSGTLDPIKLEALELIIGRLERELAAMDRASPPNRSSDLHVGAILPVRNEPNDWTALLLAWNDASAATKARFRQRIT